MPVSQYNLNYEGLPESLRLGVKNYVENRLRPGSFLTAVLKNDFLNAVCTADPTNSMLLRDIAIWVYNELPMLCWGSSDKVEKWLNREEGNHGT